MSKRPDLSSLSRDVRVRIAVAETQGARWWRCEDLVSPNPDDVAWRLGGVAVFSDTQGFVYTAPDPLADPAAWGALMEKELSGAERIGKAGAYRWRGRWNACHYGPEQPAIGSAVCAAFLAKHGIDWDTLEPVR